MSPHDLLELTSILTSHAGSFVHHASELPRESVEAYWTANRCRFDRWIEDVADCERRLSLAPVSVRPQVWGHFEPTAVEIFSTEVLTRVWGALLTAWDEVRDRNEGAPIGRSCYINHLEARNRIQNLMLKWRPSAPDICDRWNRLRRTSERTTDQLLATLPEIVDYEDFAFDKRRYRMDRVDWIKTGKNSVPGAVDLSMQALVQLMRHRFMTTVRNEDLHGRIAASILGCLHADMFYSTGNLRSVWRIRMHSFVGDTQILLNEAIDIDSKFRWR